MVNPLRDTRQAVLAGRILGNPAERKAGYRYVRVPGQKRTYAVKTDANPSAGFAGWVQSGLLRVPDASIRKVTIQSYSIDERTGRLTNLDSVALTRESDQWKLADAEKLNTAAVQSMAAALDNLKVIDVQPKPPGLAMDLRSGKLELSLETAVSLRQKDFFLTPNGRRLANPPTAWFMCCAPAKLQAAPAARTAIRWQL